MEKINAISDNYLLITLFEILSVSNYSTKFNQVTNESENKENKMDIENENSNVNQDEKIINLSSDIIKFLSIEEKTHLRMYAFEAIKTRQGSIYFTIPRFFS
jgi:hypothetical protein